MPKKYLTSLPKSLADQFDQYLEAYHKNASEAIRELIITRLAGKPIEPSIPKIECKFGSYLPDKKMVFCQCHWKSVMKWLPKNRLVPLEVCLNHYPQVKQIEEFIESKRTEKDNFAEAYGKGTSLYKASQPLKKISETIYCALEGHNVRRNDLDVDKCFKCPNIKCEAHP